MDEEDDSVIPTFGSEINIISQSLEDIKNDFPGVEVKENNFMFEIEQNQDPLDDKEEVLSQEEQNENNSDDAAAFIKSSDNESEEQKVNNKEEEAHLDKIEVFEPFGSSKNNDLHKQMAKSMYVPKSSPGNTLLKVEEKPEY